MAVFNFSFRENKLVGFLDHKLNQKVELSGIIIDEPDIRIDNQKLKVAIQNQKARVLINTSLDKNFNYGDEIKFFGKIQKPENFSTDLGKEFDYINYLYKDKIIYLFNYPQIEIMSRDNGLYLKSFLFKIKGKFLEKINLLLPQPESTLAGGLILGERSSFSPILKQNFIDTGTIHIVALSGYNVSIVAEWIMKVFKFLSFNLSIYLGILTIFLFVLMTGGASTAIRAGVMAILMLLARSTGRNYDVGRALVLAAVFMIFLNPFLLVYDLSFILSFLATIGVIFFTPKIEKYFLWVSKNFGLRDIISVSCAAYVFVLPFLLYQMGNFSLVALPANILILPFVPFTMFFSFLAGFIGIFSYLLATPIVFIAYLFLHYEISIVNFLAQFSFSSFSIPNFPLFLTILFYIYFAYFLFGKSIKKFFIETEN